MPDYNEKEWNDGTNDVPGDGVQGNNNCYDYACDKKSGKHGGHKSQPGKAHGIDLKRATCDEVTAGAIADGLKPTTKNDQCGENCWKVALVVDEWRDYHWYRQDSNGKWSHKPDHLQATNRDGSNNEITDPESADRRLIIKGKEILNYTKFCGYFCVCPPILIAFHPDLGAKNRTFTGTFAKSITIAGGPVLLTLPPGHLTLTHKPLVTMSKVAKIVVPMFSGREDRSWIMSMAQTRKLMKSIQAMETASELPDDFVFKYFAYLPVSGSSTPTFISIGQDFVGAWYAPNKVSYLKSSPEFAEWVASTEENWGDDKPSRNRRSR